MHRVVWRAEFVQIVAAVPGVLALITVLIFLPETNPALIEVCIVFCVVLQAWPLASAYCRSELAPRTLGCATHHHGVCSSACAASARALWPLLAFAGYRWLGASEVAEDPTARRAFADAQGPPTHTSYLRACVLVALSSTADASRMPHKHDSADTAASDVTGAALRLGFPCVFRASFGLR